MISALLSENECLKGQLQRYDTENEKLRSEISRLSTHKNRPNDNKLGNDTE